MSSIPRHLDLMCRVAISHGLVRGQDAFRAHNRDRFRVRRSQTDTTRPRKCGRAAIEIAVFGPKTRAAMSGHHPGHAEGEVQVSSVKQFKIIFPSARGGGYPAMAGYVRARTASGAAANRCQPLEMVADRCEGMAGRAIYCVTLNSSGDSRHESEQNHHAS